MDTGTDEAETAFDAYVEALIGVIGHADRADPLKDHRLGLFKALERKSAQRQLRLPVQRQLGLPVAPPARASRREGRSGDQRLALAGADS
jgi:hypothetical protein